MERIESLDDPRLGPFLSIRDRDLRAEGLFLVETPDVIRRFLAAEAALVDSVLLSAEAYQLLAAEMASLRAPILVAENQLLCQTAGYTFHRGALLLAHRTPPPDWAQTLAGIDSPTRILLVEGVMHVDNLGSLFRSAWALQADLILLDSTCTDPLLRKAIRVSMGRVFSIPWAVSANWTETLTQLQAEHGFQILALENSPEARPLGPRPKGERVALLLGSEKSGLSAASLQLADQTCLIPTREQASLNVSVCAAIALYALG